MIGRYNGVTIRRFDGLIDDSGVFNRVLSSAEVASIYARGLVQSAGAKWDIGADEYAATSGGATNQIRIKGGVKIKGGVRIKKNE